MEYILRSMLLLHLRVKCIVITSLVLPLQTTPLIHIFATLVRNAVQYRE
jgi:hypothetical protein